MKNFLFNHVLHTLLCLCMFFSGATLESVAQSDNNKNDLISVTLKVKSSDGIPYRGAKIWDATLFPIIDTNFRTDKNGEITLKVIPHATLIVGEYLLWDESTNDMKPIDEIFGSQGKDYYTQVEIKGRSSIDVIVNEFMMEQIEIRRASIKRKTENC